MAPGRSLSPEVRKREPHGERSKSKDRDRDRDRPRDKDRDRDRERDRVKDREADRAAGRKRGRSASKERDGADAKDLKRRRSRSRERKRSRSRDRDRDRERKDGRDSGRDKDRRDRDRDRGHRDGDKDRRTGASEKRKEDREEGETNEELANGVPAPAKKAEPLALEELLAKRKQELEAQAKPVFMSKKQREELALQRRQEEAQAMRAAQEERRKAEAELQRRKEAEEAERRRDEDRRKRTSEREAEKLKEMIKAQYLGGDKVKKKVLKGSEKFRFNFDWGADDDTSKDLNPLYASTHQAHLLFGRGMLAGIDRREQKKTAAEQERALMRKLRESQGIAETKEDRARDRERAMVADAYDKADMRVDSHWSEKPREAMTERDWRIFREDYNISYRGNFTSAALPIRNWEEAKLPKELMKAIEKQGYKKPSPIQMAALPLGLQQRDVIGIAETGSGKTAAFVLPMLVYIQKQPVMTEEVAVEGPYAVVLAPTRELAQQIEEEAAKLAAFTPYRMVSVVGGQNIEDQGFKLRKGCEIVIATPGRLLDCLEKSYAVLNQCNYVVLDEADRMIDMGFEPQVLGVMDAMPSTNLKPESEDVELEVDRIYRTTYMFSATMPSAVERLARKYLRRPVVITIGSAGRVTDNVTQIVKVAKDNDKPAMLKHELEHETLDDKAVSRVIIFANTKRQCDNVCKQLDELGYSCTLLHGGKTQDQREASLAGFRENKYDVLVATDVAGRGIDVPEVSMVINYDMPGSIEQYTHRIGRTGRAGRKGRAITFITMHDQDVFYDLKKLLEDSGTSVPPQIAHHEAARVKPGAVEGRRRDQTVYAKT